MDKRIRNGFLIFALIALIFTLCQVIYSGHRYGRYGSVLFQPRFQLHRKTHSYSNAATTTLTSLRSLVTTVTPSNVNDDADYEATVLTTPADRSMAAKIQWPSLIPLQGSHGELSTELPTINQTLAPEIAKIYDRLKRVESRPLQNPQGTTWKRGTFCHDFFVKTFDQPVPVCDSEMSYTDSIKCYGSSHDGAHMGSCILENVAVKPSHLSSTVKDGMDVKFVTADVVTLLNDLNTSCPRPTSRFFEKKVETGDFENQLIKHVAKNTPKASSVCKHWIDKLTFFFTAQKFHVYFEMLSYYDLHKMMWDYNVTTGDFLIVRITDDHATRFPLETADRALFPETISLKELPDDTVCFKKIVLVPQCFSSVLFRSKMNSRIKANCFKCDGRSLSGTPMYTFRQRVLKGCSVHEKLKANMITPKIAIVSRTPYSRFPRDEVKNFQRVLTNEKELVARLRETFPAAIVSVLHLEVMEFCDQVRRAHEQDILLGVHGAGMVHIWWLEDDALALELEPTFQATNPTFRMLSTLTGRKYAKVSIHGNQKRVSVDVNMVLNELKKVIRT